METANHKSCPCSVRHFLLCLPKPGPNSNECDLYKSRAVGRQPRGLCFDALSLGTVAGSSSLPSTSLNQHNLISRFPPPPPRAASVTYSLRAQKSSCISPSEVLLILAPALTILTQIATGFEYLLKYTRMDVLHRVSLNPYNTSEK